MDGWPPAAVLGSSRACRITWPHYARGMNKHLGDKLTEAEAEKLAALLGKLIET